MRVSSLDTDTYTQKKLNLFLRWTKRYGSGFYTCIFYTCLRIFGEKMSVSSWYMKIQNLQTQLIMETKKKTGAEVESIFLVRFFLHLLFYVRLPFPSLRPSSSLFHFLFFKKSYLRTYSKFQDSRSTVKKSKVIFYYYVHGMIGEDSSERGGSIIIISPFFTFTQWSIHVHF